MAKRIIVKLVGVKFKNEDGTSRQDLLGQLYDDWYTEGKQAWVRLKLVAEPDNPHDSNAVAVHCVKPPLGKLGHVSRDQARVLCTRLDMIDRVELVKMHCGGSISAVLHLAVKRKVKDTEGREYEIV